MRTTQSDLDREQIWTDNKPIMTSLTSLQEGASVGTPWLPEEDMGRRRSPLSEYMSLHLSLN